MDILGFEFEDEQNFVAVKLPPGFPVDDINELCELLRDADPLVPAFKPPEVGVYSLQAQVWALQVDELDTVIIPDRNVASRMAQIAKGGPVSKDARVVAGIVAFAHFFDILMEPSIAFHELGRQEGNEAALQELSWFRAADHGEKFDWLDVALGRSDRLAQPGTPRSLESLDLAMGLRDWSTGYGAVLKLAEIELFHRGAPLEKLMTLLDWMHHDYFLSGQVAIMACLYFGPVNAPKAGLMKSLRSPDRQRAIDGAKNAAWDALYLSKLISIVNEAAGSPKRYLYASLDRKARLIARMALAFGADGPHHDVMAGMLSEWWSPGDAKQIATKLVEATTNLDAPEMQEKRRRASLAKRDTIARGESAVRQWPA